MVNTKEGPRAIKKIKFKKGKDNEDTYSNFYNEVKILKEME